MHVCTTHASKQSKNLTARNKPLYIAAYLDTRGLGDFREMGVFSLLTGVCINFNSAIKEVIVAAVSDLRLHIIGAMRYLLFSPFPTKIAASFYFKVIWNQTNRFLLYLLDVILCVKL